VSERELRILDLEQWDVWKSVLKTIELEDVYFQPEYLMMQQANGDGQARLALYKDIDGIVAYPFLMRDIDLTGYREGFKDITSPYGYSGPVVRCHSRDHDVAVGASFIRSFRRFCTQNRIVSEFVRFHPLLENWRFFNDSMGLEYVRDTVVIDLTKPLEQIWQDSFKGRVRTAIRKALKAGVQVSFHDEVFSDFTELYQLTMRRLEASRYYFFSERYFAGLNHLVKTNGVTAVARHEGKAIGCAVLLKGRDFAHYHLSASNPNYRSLPATDLIIWEAIQWAKAHDLKAFHLGGGYSGNNDSLYRFKAGFSPKRGKYVVGKFIHLPDVYDDLTRYVFGSDYDTAVKNGFFPLYRLDQASEA
jgi:hypothetical protein